MKIGIFSEVDLFIYGATSAAMVCAFFSTYIMRSRLYRFFFGTPVASLDPVSEFLTELTLRPLSNCADSDAETPNGELQGAINDKKNYDALFEMLHPSVLRVAEPGAIRALARCISTNHGTFTRLDNKGKLTRGEPSDAHTIFTFSGDAYFSVNAHTPVPIKVCWTVDDSEYMERYNISEEKENASELLNDKEFFSEGDSVAQSSTDTSTQSASVSKRGVGGISTGGHRRVPWWRRKKRRWIVYSFEIQMPADIPLDYAVAADFSPFASQVINSLLSPTPFFAHGVMVAELQRHYKNGDDLAKAVAPAIEAAQLRRKITGELEIDQVSARIVREDEKYECIEFGFVAKGKKKDLIASLRVVLVGIQAFVAKYAVVVSPQKTQSVQPKIEVNIE